MFQRVILIVFLFLIQYAEAQKSVVIPGKGDIYAHRLYGDYAYFMVGADNAYESHLYRMKLPDGQPEALDTSILYAQSVRMGDSGVFYLSFEWDANGNDGRHTLNFMPAGGTRKRVLKVINLYIQHPNRTRPEQAKIIDGRYHIVGWFNSQNCIWESDGSVSGTQVIFQTGQQVKDYSLYQNKPLAILNNGQKEYIVNSQQQMLSPDYKQNFISPLRFFYSSNAVCIYAYNHKMYFCGEPGKVDSASLNFEGLRIFSKVEASDSVIYGYNYVGRHLYTYRLRIAPPVAYDSIAPSAGILALENPQYSSIDSRFMSFWSFSTGFEMLFAPTQDSMRLIRDLNPGHASGTAQITFRRQLLEDGGIAYFSANNGSDGKGYLYSSDGRFMKSHFPWGNFSTGISGLFIKDSLYYWSSFRDDSLFIVWRSLSGRDTQPSAKEKVRSVNKDGEWMRTAAPVYSLSPSYYAWNNVKSYAVQSDKGGNVFVCGSVRELGPAHYLRFSDTGIIQQMKGDQMVIKYDSAGRLQWSKTIGGINSWTSLDPAFHVDNTGDVLVFSNYYQRAVFDSIELNTPRAAMYLCKLDGKTGSVKWARQYNPTFYSNDNSTDNLVSDREGNIYLSFTFKNFSAVIGPNQIQTDRSPANGLVKLDSDGTVIWARGNETPWTDKYGISRDMVYDSASNRIFNLIGQGFYNWSASCRYAPFRSILYRISPDGDVNELQELYGNDLNAATVAEITGNKSVFVSGFYRSRMDLTRFSLTSGHDQQNGCSRRENFYATVHAGSGTALSLQGTENDAFFPFDACSDAQFIYVLGAQRNPASKHSGYYRLSIRRYTHLGRYTGKRLLQDCYTGDPFDFNFYYNIHLSGSHFLLSMSTGSGISPFTNYVEHYEGLSVYRLLKDKDWTDAVNYRETIPEAGVLVAPNPATDHISLQFTETERYNRLDIYDALGRMVKTVHLSSDLYQIIPLDSLGAGVYTLHFSGQGNHKEKLVIR